MGRCSFERLIRPILWQHSFGFITVQYDRCPWHSCFFVHVPCADSIDLALRIYTCYHERACTCTLSLLRLKGICCLQHRLYFTFTQIHIHTSTFYHCPSKRQLQLQNVSCEVKIESTATTAVASKWCAAAATMVAGSGDVPIHLITLREHCWQYWKQCTCLACVEAPALQEWCNIAEKE